MTTVFVNALVSCYLHLPVGRVEAGLRSGNNVELFPDEANRQLISRINIWLFSPISLYQCPRARSTMIIHDNQFGDSRAAREKCPVLPRGWLN